LWERLCVRRKGGKMHKRYIFVYLSLICAIFLSTPCFCEELTLTTIFEPSGSLTPCKDQLKPIEIQKLTVGCYDEADISHLQEGDLVVKDKIGIKTTDPSEELHIKDGSILITNTKGKDGEVEIDGGSTWPSFKLSADDGPDKYKIELKTTGACFLENKVDVGDANLIIGKGGTGKITVGTVDPVFNIDGRKYATYVPDFAGGVRIETSGIIDLQSLAKKQPRFTFCGRHLIYNYVIDFENLEQGSNLWLFWQTSNKNLKDLAVLLTPNFKGRAWYEKKDNSLIIYGEKKGEISYRFSAPRIDHKKWGNIAGDQSIFGIDVSKY